MSPASNSRFGKKPLGSGVHLEGLFRLDREADRDIGRTVEHLDKLTAEQTMILALGAGS